MKKILLSLIVFCSFVMVKAQNVVLNEVYGNPGGSNSEFIELYNSGASGSMDCYTIMTYYENENGSVRGWYVLDLPNTPPISSTPGYYVLSSVTPFNVQGNPGALADVNWNSLAFRNGSTGGFLRQFGFDGTNYTQVPLADATPVNNLLDGTLNGSQIYITLLFRNGSLINGFVGGGATGSILTLLGDMKTFEFPINCGGIESTSSINFTTLTTVEFFNPSGGNDNGYARSSDGKCGAWVKTAPQVNHTPGITNGSATGLAGSLDVALLFRCGEALGDPAIRLESNITNFSGDVTFLDDFPVIVELVYDVNGDGIQNAGDFVHPTTKSVSDTAISTVDTFHIIQSPGQLDWNFIVTYRTKRGCFDRVVALSPSCATLPVTLTSFTAARSRSNVSLKWETAMEDNSKGFELQRKIGFYNWETIGFVPTKAINGNSSSPLYYEYTDINTTTGVTQYRLKQVDIDGRYAYSQIRSVRGESQKSNTIVYPNPSSDGKVSIVFEDANGTRDVQVIDMSGRTIKQWKAITTNNITVDNLNAGFYTVRIVNNETGEQVVEKFVVNKR